MTSGCSSWGRDRSAGVLLNLTSGARPFDPINRACPTVVVTHGLNPMAPLFRFAMAERYAEAIGTRYGAGVNVLSWNWNGVTMRSLLPGANNADALAQGWALGAALVRAGVDPARAPPGRPEFGMPGGGRRGASALAAHGRRVARLTLLDPIGSQHSLIFDHLGAALRLGG